MRTVLFVIGLLLLYQIERFRVNEEIVEWTLYIFSRCGRAIIDQ